MYDCFPPCVFADLEPRECQDVTLRIQRSAGCLTECVALQVVASDANHGRNT